jgi:hydroxyacyl-ACP dehydratase HTD2-like protein with hotdog domain
MEEVFVGQEIPFLVKRPTSIGMFRFSAVMWNAHRTHVDHPYATGKEGHASTLAQDYLLATYLVEMLDAWAGPVGRVRSLNYRNRGPVHANTTVTCWGKVTGVESTSEGNLVTLDVGIENAQKITAVPGTATVLIPGN